MWMDTIIIQSDDFSGSGSSLAHQAFIKSMSYYNLFNVRSKDYAESRPQYPGEPFEYLNSICEMKAAAWDGACGNGQAAIGLAQYFNRVEATDISEQQIKNAIQHPRVSYSVQASEATTFQENQFDLVCIAQALHWFNYDKFWPEVKRVLKKDGLFAAWGYSWFSIDESIDGVIKEKLLKIIEPYWAPQNQLLWDNYRDVSFPFERLDVPEIEMKVAWDLKRLLAYLMSWSAVQVYLKNNGRKPIDDAFSALKTAWGDESIIRTVEMDFCMLVGRNISWLRPEKPGSPGKQKEIL